MKESDFRHIGRLRSRLSKSRHNPSCHYCIQGGIDFFKGIYLENVKCMLRYFHQSDTMFAWMFSILVQVLPCFAETVSAVELSPLLLNLYMLKSCPPLCMLRCVQLFSSLYLGSQEVIGNLTSMVEQILHLCAVGVSCMTAKHVNSSSIVFAPTPHHIVLKVGLCHIQGWVDLHLEDIFTRSYISDVDPLTVNIMAVRVPTAHWDALLSHVIAGEALMEAFRAVCVLQAETCFVAFSDSSSIQSQ